MKKYQTTIGIRYLRSRLVNVLAVLAVMFGVAGLIIVFSVMSGFARDFEERIRGVMSHIVVKGDQLAGLDNYERLMERIEKAPLVAACSPLVESPFVLIRSGKYTQFAQLRGIDIEREKKVSEIEQYRQKLCDKRDEMQGQVEAMVQKSGKRTRRRIEEFDERKFHLARTLALETFSFDARREGESAVPGAIIGFELAYLFNLNAGSRISITSPTPILTFQAKDFDVVGAFRCGHYQYDSQLIYVPLIEAQNLLGLPGRATSISVRVRDMARADEAKAQIEQAIRNPTPLVRIADPADRARLQALAGAFEVQKETDDTWLRITPPEVGVRTARLAIKGLGPVLAEAGDPTVVAFDLRLPRSASHDSAPSFRIALVDSAGREFFADAGIRRWFTSAGKASLYCGIATFLSEDGLDVLEPSQISGAIIEANNGPIEVANLRFEDDRRVAVRTWRDECSKLLRAVDIERVILSVIMTIMVVIAGFAILAILWLMVKEKTRDIGILMSLGATRGGIIRIFIMNGLMIGVVGGGLGLAAGWTISANLNHIEDWVYATFGWQVFPPSIYYLDRIPHMEDPVQFTTMALTAVVVSLVAAVWPALKASRLDPVEALRYE